MFYINIIEIVMEIFRKIDGYQYYEVSNLGRVRSLDHYVEGKDGVTKFFKGRLLRSSLAGEGYPSVMLTQNGVQKRITIHRLVAKAFIPNPSNLPCVNHKNEVKTDNIVENLEWCDYEYNNNYGTKPERLSKSMIGRPAWNKGKKMSEEQKAKLRGRIFSEEHIKHLCESARKRIRTEEEIQRWRTASLGRHHTEETKQKMREARKLYWEKKKSINN